MRFELTTLTLARLCSTPELRPRPLYGRVLEINCTVCKGENAEFGKILERLIARTTSIKSYV